MEKLLDLAPIITVVSLVGALVLSVGKLYTNTSTNTPEPKVVLSDKVVGTVEGKPLLRIVDNEANVVCYTIVNRYGNAALSCR